MPRKAAPKAKRKPSGKAKPDAAAQYKRFLETANAVGASDDPKALENALKKCFLQRELRGEPAVKKIAPAKKRSAP